MYRLQFTNGEVFGAWTSYAEAHDVCLAYGKGCEVHVYVSEFGVWIRVGRTKL